MNKKYEYQFEYVNEDGQSEIFEIAASSDEEALDLFEVEAGYNELDVVACNRIAL